MAEAKDRLHWNCTSCQWPCEHAGAAVSLLLEEKTALRLAAPPPERIPVESLSEEELVARAIAERDDRSLNEKFKLQSQNPKQPWTNYSVTSAATGKTIASRCAALIGAFHTPPVPTFARIHWNLQTHLVRATAGENQVFPATTSTALAR
jgi:hypothetical protein